MLQFIYIISLVSTCAPSETLATADLSGLSEPSDVRTICVLLIKVYVDNLQVVNSEVTVSTGDLELIPHSEMVRFFTKGKNRPHFAAFLVAHLFDEETRLKSNVRGKGKDKEKLDNTVKCELLLFGTWFILGMLLCRWVKESR